MSITNSRLLILLQRLPHDVSKPVAWEEVARYVVAVARSTSRCRPVAQELKQLQDDDEAALRDELRKMVSNRAAKYLLREGLRWSLQEGFPLGSLYFRGGDKADKRKEIAEKIKRVTGKHPTVEQFVQELKRLPRDQWDCSVWAFLPDEKGAKLGANTLVVHQERPGGDWCIGDGYHRAGAWFWDGKRTARTYAGEMLSHS